MAELTEHLENLQRVKSKLEDKQVMKAKIDDLSASVETVQNPRGGDTPAEPSGIAPEPQGRRAQDTF